MKRNLSTVIKIRMASAREASKVARLLRDAFAEYEASYTKEGFSATTPTAALVRSRMDEGPMWVAVQADEIVGTVSAIPRGEALYIRGMAVYGAARGQGVGKLLLREVESFALERGHKRLVLSTTPFLDRAIRLYEHAGFRRNDEGPHDLFGTPLFTMSKSLKISDRKMFKDEK